MNVSSITVMIDEEHSRFKLDDPCGMPKRTAWGHCSLHASTTVEWPNLNPSNLLSRAKTHATRRGSSESVPNLSTRQNVAYIFIFHLVFASSPYDPLSCSSVFHPLMSAQMSSRLELGSQVGSTTDHLTGCCLTQHTQDLSTMTAVPAAAGVIISTSYFSMTWSQAYLILWALEV